jgi:Lipocalin-like domain
MRSLSFLTLLSAALILGSCQKDDSPTVANKTKTELITSAAWKYNDAKIDTDNNGTGDAALPAGLVEACTTDNTITFVNNGTGTINEGATKCASTDPQTISFTWSFTSNETVINFSSAVFAGFSGDFKIISLTETELVLSKQLTIPPIPLPITVVVSFKH